MFNEAFGCWCCMHIADHTKVIKSSQLSSVPLAQRIHTLCLPLQDKRHIDECCRLSPHTGEEGLPYTQDIKVIRPVQGKRQCVLPEQAVVVQEMHCFWEQLQAYLRGWHADSAELQCFLPFSKCLLFSSSFLPDVG